MLVGSPRHRTNAPGAAGVLFVCSILSHNLRHNKQFHTTGRPGQS